MNEKKSYTEYVVTGAARNEFPVGFKDYQDGKDKLNVFINTVDAESQGYTVLRLVGNVLFIQPKVPIGSTVRIERETNIDSPFYVFTAGNPFVPRNIDANFTQILHSQQEVLNSFVYTEGYVKDMLQSYNDRIVKVENTVNLNDKRLTKEIQDRIQGDLDSRRYAEDLYAMGNNIWDGVSTRSVWDYIRNMSQEDINTQLLKPKDEYLAYASQLGLVPNDPLFDNAPVFEQVLTSLNGKCLILEDNSTYYVKRTVKVLDVDVSMRALGTPSEVYNMQVGANVMEVASSVLGTAQVTSSITIGSRQVVISNTTNFKVGGLFAIKSDKYWYNDPRDQTYKSQLHRIYSVDGTVINTYDAMLDGYDLDTEIVTVEAYNPIKCVISNVDFQATPIPTAPDNRPNAQGLIVRHAINPVIDNCSTKDAQACGIFLYRSYAPVVQGGISDRCNSYYTGYGVQTSGTAHALIQDRRILGSRRGVDVSGIGVISTGTVVRNNTVIGGGVNSHGDTYGWVSQPSHALGAYQGGVGSHGAADHTVYEGNTTYWIHSPLNCRSSNEYIKNNLFVGRTRNGVIDLAFGKNYTIIGNRCTSGFAYGDGRTTKVFDGGANVNSRRPDVFVNIQPTAGGRIFVSTNDIEAQNAMFRCMGNINGVYDKFIVSDNNIDFATVTGADPVFMFISSTDALLTIPSRSVFKGNTLQRQGGTGAISYFPDGWEVSNNVVMDEGISKQSNSTKTKVTSGANSSGSFSGSVNCLRVGNVITGGFVLVTTVAEADTLGEVMVELPMTHDFNSDGYATGVVTAEDVTLTVHGSVKSVSGSRNIKITYMTPHTGQIRMHVAFTALSQ